MMMIKRNNFKFKIIHCSMLILLNHIAIATSSIDVLLTKKFIFLYIKLQALFILKFPVENCVYLRYTK